MKNKSTNIASCATGRCRCRHRRCCSGRTSNGFTLMEVLLALGLIVLLLGFTGTFTIDLGRQRAQLAAASQEISGWVMIVDQLDRALTCVIAGDPSAGAGVLGGTDQVALLTRGVWLDPNADSGTNAENNAESSNAGPDDLQRLTLRYDAERGVLQLSSSSAAQQGGASASRGRGVQLTGVSAARLRYYNGRAWVESYDTTSAGALPLAIELAVWLGEVEQDSAGTADVFGFAGDDDDDVLGIGFMPDDESFGSARGRTREEPRGEPDYIRVFAIPDAREPKPADEVALQGGAQ